ncbi:MAG: PD-(D/E)XK nuclease family protein [Planctomycetota bacterium]
MTIENPSPQALKLTATQSPSRIGMIRDCPQKWAYIYVEGKRRPPTAALQYGTAWDRFTTAEDGYWAEKMQTGHDLSPAQARELFAANWKQEAEEIEEWGDDDYDVLQRIGLQATEMWVPEIGNKYLVHGIQHRWQLGLNEGEFSINGILDATLFRIGADEGQDKAVIHDEKTSKTSWIGKTGRNAGKPNKKATASLQAAGYTLAATVDPSLEGTVDPTRFVFNVHVKTKTPQIQQVEVPVEAKQHETYLRIAEASRRQQIDMIDRNYFPPNRENNMCSKAWCPFWRECVKTHGGTVPE